LPDTDTLSDWGWSAAGAQVSAVTCGKLGLTTEDLSHRRVTAVLTFLRDAGLRGS
jgi:hypothetical protein